MLIAGIVAAVAAVAVLLYFLFRKKSSNPARTTDIGIVWRTG